MKYIDIWDDLLKTYEELNRYNLFKKKNCQHIIIYSVITYTILSIIAFSLSNKHYFSMAMVIYIVAISINYYLNKKLISLYHYRHKSISLKYHENMIRFNEFKLKYENKNYGKKIENIIKWNLIRTKKIDKYRIFTSSISILILSMILSLLSGIDMFDKNKFQIAIILSVLYLFILQFIYFINDILTSKEKKMYEISRYLEWIVLEE